jgi:hypothetical protein
MMGFVTHHASLSLFSGDGFSDSLLTRNRMSGDAVLS